MVDCFHLTSACLTLHAAQPTCSSLCASRPFSVTAYGPRADAEVKAALRGLQDLKDPIDSFRLRHLERDVRAMPGAPPTPLLPKPLSMWWPAWEGGFGDLVMWTLLPMGLALHDGSLPNGTLAISGALHTRAWQQLARARPICTTERDDLYHVPDGAHTLRERVVRPFPRCRSQCHERISLCEPRPVSGQESWRAMAALDAQLGLPTPTLYSSAAYRTTGTLRILVAKRNSKHGRSLLNAAALAEECSRSTIRLGPAATRRLVQSGGDAGGGGSVWRLSCEVVQLSHGPLRGMAEALRRADVLVGMHGADLINSLHMLPGRALVEVVNAGFEHSADGPPYYFVSCFRRHATPTYVHKRLVLPPVLRGEQTAGRAWNLNGSLPFALLYRALQSILARDGTPRFEALPSDLPPPAAAAIGEGEEARDGRPAGERGDTRGGAPTTARRGHCGVTAEEEGDCELGRQGSFAMGPRLPDGAACARACRSCPRCNYVSVSQDDRDCSWYHDCELERLEASEKHLSWRVARRGGGRAGA